MNRQAPVDGMGEAGIAPVLAQMLTGDIEMAEPNTAGFIKALSLMNAMNVEPADIENDQLIIVTPVDPLSQQEPRQVTMTDVDLGVRRLRVEKGARMAFTSGRRLPKSNYGLVVREAALRATHRTVMGQALGLVGEVRTSPKLDRQFYRASHDLSILGDFVQFPIHTETDLIDRERDVSVLELYDASFKPERYQVDRGPLGSRLRRFVRDALRRSVYDLARNDHAWSERGIPASHIERLLEHFGEEGEPATLKSLLEDDTEAAVAKTTKIMSSDSKLHLAVTAAGAYFEYIAEQTGNRFASNTAQVLGDKDVSAVAVVEMANKLLANAATGDNKSARELNRKISKIPAAFRIIRSMVQARGLEDSGASIAKLGDRAETILSLTCLEA